MKLLDNLYEVTSVCKTDTGCDYDIVLNAEHFIYKAHFPGEPITPGVCIMQIAIELLQDYVGRQLQLCSAKNIKFLKIIVPTQTPTVTCRIQKAVFEEGLLKAQLSMESQDVTFAKLSLVCR